MTSAQMETQGEEEVVAWRLRLRYEGVGHTVTLPRGNKTTLLQLKLLALQQVITAVPEPSRTKKSSSKAKRSNPEDEAENVSLVVIKKGFPPVSLQDT